MAYVLPLEAALAPPLQGHPGEGPPAAIEKTDTQVKEIFILPINVSTTRQAMLLQELTACMVLCGSDYTDQ